MITKVVLTISSPSENVDIATLDEQYTLKVTSSNIVITSTNNFGAARAFASLVQLADKLQSLPEDRKAYGIYEADVQDHAAFKWR